MTTPATMDDAISDLAARMDRRRRLGGPIAMAWRRIKPHILAIPIGSDGVRHLTDDNVRALSASLSKPDDPRVHRIEQDKRLNDILAELQLHGFLKSPFMNHPVQVPRHLLLTLDDLDPAMIEHAHDFRQRLHGRSMLQPPATWPKNEEALWHFCVFLASLILDTGILFPPILGIVLHLTHQDLTPAGTIDLPRRRQRRGKRPVEATVRHRLHPVTLRAYARFQRASQSSRKSGAPSHATPLCPMKWRTFKWMRQIFPSRLRAFLNACNVPTKAFNPQHPLRLLMRYGTVAAVMRGIPPFIIDTAIGNVLTRPVTVGSYRRVFENKTADWALRAETAPDPARRRRISVRTRMQGTGLELFGELEKLRSRLRHSNGSPKARQAFIDDITRLIGPTPLQPIPGPLTQGTIFTANARVFGGFIAFLLRSKLKISSVLTRTSAIADAFPDLFGSTPLWAWTANHYSHVLRFEMEQHETDHRHACSIGGFS